MTSRRFDQPGFPPATITEFQGVRSLHLGTSWVQGAMRLSKPDWTSQFFRFVFDVNLQVDDTDLEIFPKPIDLTRDLVGLEFYSLLSERAPSPFSEHIQPKSIFYTKMISAERIRRAETFARENGVGFVRKSAGLTASQFLKDLGLLT